MWKYLAEDSFSVDYDARVTLSVDKRMFTWIHFPGWPNLIEPLTYNERPLKLTIKYEHEEDNELTNTY